MLFFIYKFCLIIYFRSTTLKELKTAKMLCLEVWIRYVIDIWASAYKSIFWKHERLKQSVQHIPGKFCIRHPMQLWKMFCIQNCPTQMSIIMETFIPIYSCWTNSAAALCIHCRPPRIELLTLQDQSLGEEFVYVWWHESSLLRGWAGNFHQPAEFSLGCRLLDTSWTISFRWSHHDIVIISVKPMVDSTIWRPKANTGMRSVFVHERFASVQTE